jgi:hypothetical protein
MRKQDGAEKPQTPLGHEYGGLASSAFFRKQKGIDELDRLLEDGEAQRRQREAARNNALDVMLMALVVVLVLTALTRLAVWLARAF